MTTLTCSTTANSTPSGEQCPQSTVRNILFNQEVDLALNQPGIVNGILTIPPGYAPALAMAPDVLVSGAQCTFPNPGSLAGQLCPQSILTQLEDNTIKTGGYGQDHEFELRVHLLRTRVADHTDDCLVEQFHDGSRILYQRSACNSQARTTTTSTPPRGL